MLKCIAFILTVTPMYVVESESIPQHGISYRQIIKNNPTLNDQYAKELSIIVDKWALKYGIQPDRLAAILAQESMYRLNAVNKRSRDYGIAQINHRTMINFGFDKRLLLTDLEYSVKAGAIVLADFKRMYGHREQDYWTRYNSSDPERRQEYKELVAKFE